MLHANNKKVKELLLKGEFGLEKESLRIDEKGFLSHTEHPFKRNKYIVRDFCENQVEINTPVFKSVREAVEHLDRLNRQIQSKLAGLSVREYIWPFSNPPYIRNEEDIPIAKFSKRQSKKTTYREYLSDRYGRYKMSLSGVHVNYSFDDELLRADFAVSGEKDFEEYKNQLYVMLAEKAAAYGWLLVAVTAASPLMDGSFVEKKRYDEDNFNGMASVRCSELGYWNFFAPIFDYSDIRSYADSIKQYVEDGWIKYPSELYYPIRLKPAGENNLESLRNNGVNHIELRMFDLNPFISCGVEEKDVIFAQLLLVWLASTKRKPLTTKDQIQAVQNFKNAAHYDLKTVKIVIPNDGTYSVTDAALKVISSMKEFYSDFSDDIHRILEFEEAKFIEQSNRYSWKVRQLFGGNFVKRGLELAKRRQEEAVNGNLSDCVTICTSIHSKTGCMAEG